MAENSFDAKPVKAKLKPGVLPGVRQIRRPDFSKSAADIEKTEEARQQALIQEENGAPEDAASAVEDAQEAAAVAASLAAQEGAPEEEKLDESAITDEPKWYVAHTYSGYENKVKINIEKTIQNRHLENQIFEVRVPMHDAVEVKDGKKKNVSRKMFPGYVLVRMIMNDDTWYVVRNTRGVTGFVGPGSKPVPLTEAEMKPRHPGQKYFCRFRGRRHGLRSCRNLEGPDRGRSENGLWKAVRQDQPGDLRARNTR